MGQARNTERRWSRALQHERSLRLKLEENLETLACQMQGLENEARLSVQGPSQAAATSPEFPRLSPSPSPSPGSAGPVFKLKKVSPRKKVATFDSPEEVPGGAWGGGEEQQSDEEFFDAPEISSSQASPVSSMEVHSKDILSLVSDRKMTVSI